MLVRARYAVRNNQRAFLALKLPAQSVLWSAALAGRPVRPGVVGRRRLPAAAAQGTRGRSRADLCRRARLPPADARLDRKGRGASRTAGRRSSGLPHWTGRQPLAALSCRTDARSVFARRLPAGALECGASRTTSPARCGQAPDTPAPPQAAGDRDAASAKALVDRFRKDSGTDGGGDDTGPRHRARASARRFSSQPS